MVVVEGRLISRERLVKETNKKVTFYSIHSVKGWAGVSFDDKIDMEKIEVPGLVRIEVISARISTNTDKDGVIYKNKKFFANVIENIETSEEFEAYEQDLLEKKINGEV
ncbi:MAG: hypothetical protein KAR20_26640 [Candidatus Heimdallarchaeota archaeon]|nr:hypothetical protein [Candidatus Heimdallarchaeota archaeon]